jgi:O-antigen/teichoic acid export membrane protein
MLSSADRYFSVLLNLVTLLVTARLLTPAEFGIAVIGLSVLGIADIIRDFGGVAYLVQVDTVTPQRVQTVFTVTFLLTLPFIGLVLFLAKPIADFYGSPGLQLFLQIASLCFLLGPFIAPANALLRREFAFGKLAVMNGASVVLNATVTIVLAMLGFSYMCFVWGGLASGLLYFVACLIWGPKIKIYRFALDEWRHVTAFGVYDSAKNMLHYAYETAPYLAFGKTLGPDGLGLFQRALSISRLPEKTLLAGLAPVILPALSQLAREGRDLKAGFLSSIEHVTALLWPTLLVIAILAKPLVVLLLGKQWLEAVPIVQIIAIASLFWLPSSIANAVQVAAGGVRDTFILALVAIPIAVAIQIFASTFGLTAAALSLFIAIPFFLIATFIAVRWRVPFTWRELGSAVKRSAVLALVSAVGPAIVAISSGGTHEISIAGGILGFVLAAIGWFTGLRIARHPMFDEVARAVDFAFAFLTSALGSKAAVGDERRRWLPWVR